MRIIRSVGQMQKTISKLKQQGKRIGFVPTMGYLHEGHLSLIRRCRKENDIVVISIFVNPTQFGPKEDFRQYPRDFQRDYRLAKREHVDIIFFPSRTAMYPPKYKTYIEVQGLGEILCGKFRPGHFRGVTTIVGKLLNIVMPTTLYLGQKDAQQAVIIQQMISDLHFPVKVRVRPIVRERDGLAMSSRNKYLSKTERQRATALYTALMAAKDMIRKGEKKTKRLRQRMRHILVSAKIKKIDYIEFVNARTLEPVSIIHGDVVIAIAAYVGKTRLIDNIIIRKR